jgi:predicted porin
MKKTLVAVSVLGAFAGSALAADVQLYGILDTGVGYSHIDMDTSGVDDVDSFEMKSGVGSGSRWGLKGTEDLGNGLTVGFILENGFDSDDGSEDSTGVMFNRESSLFLEGSFGKLAFGRMGALNSGQSSWSKVGMINAFGTSYGEFTAQASNVFSLAGQWDNMIAYETPDFAGFKLFTQYGMGSNDNENESSSNRFYSLGVTYNNGPFAGYFAVDSINYKTAKFSKGEWPNNGDDIDDSLTVTLGGSYDFDVVKIYLGAQYFDEVRLSSLGGPICRANDVRDLGISGFDLSINDIAKLKGYGISLSGDAPLAGGRVMFGLGYVDADAADSLDKALSQNIAGFRDFEIQRYVVSAGYSYPFSKRTDVYGVASYMQDNEDTSRESGTLEQDPSAYSFYVGLRHRF